MPRQAIPPSKILLSPAPETLRVQPSSNKQIKKRKKQTSHGVNELFAAKFLKTIGLFRKFARHNISRNPLQ